MAKPYQDTRSAQLEGPAALSGLKLARMSGREAISTPFEYRLSLVGSGASGSDGALDTDQILGQSVTVALVTSGTGVARYFNGIVSEFTHVGYGERFHEYQAVLRPSLWLLTRRADCRIFQNKSTPDIFADVAGTIAHRVALSGTYNPWDYRVQYRESDFDFVSRLLEHEGIYYYFEHSAGKHELVLTDDVGKLTAQTGYDTVPYHPPTATPNQRDRDHLTTLTVHKSFQPAAFAAVDYNFETPKAVASASSPVSSRKDSATYEIFEYPAGASKITASDVEALAKLRAERLYATQSVIHCDGDAAGLEAGRLFTLSGHPRTALNQKYLVTAAVCELTSDSGQTHTGAPEAAPQFSIAIDAVEADAPYRPDRITPKPVIQGSQTARVVGPSGNEIWTDKYGRVKVQFYWDRAGKSDDTSSCWLRVAHSWAGKGWGSVHVPRVGQEVVVSFLDGDPDRPLVIGSVYNAEQMPPYELPTNGTQSGLKSSSSPSQSANTNFNEFRFEDKKNAEEVYLHAEKDMVVLVENNQTLTVGALRPDKGDRKTTVYHDDTLTVGNDLSVTVAGKESRTITGDRTTTVANDTVTVSQSFKLSAGTQLTLECGAAKIVLASDGSVTISGNTLKLSGTQSAAMDATQTTISGTQVSISGTKTAVAGSGTLQLSASGMASLKGAITQIG